MRNCSVEYWLTLIINEFVNEMRDHGLERKEEEGEGEGEQEAFLPLVCSTPFFRLHSILSTSCNLLSCQIGNWSYLPF